MLPCTTDMHIRYSFVKQNYSDVLRLNGKTISNGEIENICRYIFSICGWRTKYHREIFTVNIVDSLRIEIDSLPTNNDIITS